VDPHDVQRTTRCWLTLNNVRDGDIDVRRAAENTYANDRLVDPRSIEAGKPSKIAKPIRADRHAKRLLKERRAYSKTRWQKLKRWLGFNYA
jgi:hypothetical protein